MFQLQRFDTWEGSNFFHNEPVAHALGQQPWLGTLLYGDAAAVVKFPGTQSPALRGAVAGGCSRLAEGTPRGSCLQLQRVEFDAQGLADNIIFLEGAC